MSKCLLIYNLWNIGINSCGCPCSWNLFYQFPFLDMILVGLLLFIYSKLLCDSTYSTLCETGPFPEFSTWSSKRSQHKWYCSGL